MPVEADRKLYHSTSTSAPPTTPAIAPRYVKRRQNSDRMTTGPNAEPKPPQAFSTMFMMACAPSPLFVAMM